MNLFLILKGEFFDIIASGEKREEYRDRTEYWLIRLMYHDIVSRNNVACFRFPTTYKPFTTITFQHGYSKTARRMVVECKGIDIGPAKPEWSGGMTGDVFRIRLGNIISKNF